VKLSAEATYALRAVFDIAFHDATGPAKSEQIAEREDVPVKFLEQILRKLKGAGLVESRRGPKGGYSLKPPAEEITVGAVVRAIEGPTLHGCCYQTDAETIQNCDLSLRCVTSATWRDLAVQINDVLETVTVADMLERAARFGFRRKDYDGFVYII
jgi:Rrf2 family transcriptional regulator, iron-sulfur cluster assembly transcription factor